MGKTKGEFLAGVQFPASRSPRYYNMTLIAMDEYAQQQVNEFKENLKARINEAPHFDAYYKQRVNTFIDTTI